jgi:hypothetical protein
MHVAPRGVPMLQHCSARVQALIDKATAARDRALHATWPEDRQFWLDMEAKWLLLARNVQYVERTSDFLASEFDRT